MPRRRIIRSPARSVHTVTVSTEEGEVLSAHLQALDTVWTRIATDHGMPDALPCSHVKAALRLVLFPHVGGLMPCDRALFEKAGLPLPDLTTELGPLAGDFDPCALAAHAATGCACGGSIPTIRVQYAVSVPVATIMADATPERPAHTAPGYAWEAELMTAYQMNIRRGLQAVVRGIGSTRCCVHLASAVRRGCAATAPRAAALEAEVLARAGVTLPEYRDEVVDRWMNIPGDDGTLKAHLETCPDVNGPDRWPAVIVCADGATRPVRVPAARGSELKWPEPRWS